MSASRHIDGYINRFRQRLKRLNQSRGAALIAVAALVITLIAVTLAIRSGFPSELMIGARLALVAAIAGLAAWFIVLPNRRIEDDGIDEMEARSPAFDGRLKTYADMRDPDSPFRELLAEDAAGIAAANAPEDAVPQKDLTLAWGATAVAAVALLVLGIAGPGNYGYGVRDLWLGWAIPGIAPPQNIEVTPGDSGIRAGGTLRVAAIPQGFSPGDAEVHARIGDDDWQTVSMASRDDGFEFTFFSVREPIEYYVSAAGVRSPAFRVEVVDLPGIESLTNVYSWPEWTGREPETRDPGGDVRAIAETEVRVDITGTENLTPTVLIVDDEEIPLSIDAANGSATFTVAEDGQYHVAAVVGGERIRLSDDYFITVLEDRVPEIEFTRPGRDWSASAVEEVTATISAVDDFRVESLELHYSVNGGDWNIVELEAGEAENEAEYVFMLESFADGAGEEQLVPGDLVSYFAVANDRNGSANTDIYFVDVQRFDRRYSQSQMAGGGGGGQGQQQDEISRRQREIIVSTWNLIREESEERADDAMYVPDNAALLSRLQERLRGQAMSLAQRTRARMLTASDPQIEEFVEYLERAAESMVPAAERLAEIDLDAAILPEQEALQYLLRAEAVFNDINVSTQAGAQGGGGQAGRDLSDMFELEMDLEKNQYETGSQATPDAPQQALDELGNELEELARRQEQLAKRMRADQQPTPAQRWQQDMLRREAEQLRERLERMQQQESQQQQASNQQGQQGQQGQQSSSGQQGQSGQQSPGQSGQQSGEPGQSASGEPAGERRLDELRRRMDSALRAMNDADDAMRQGADGEASQRAANEAQRQLEGARDQAAAESSRLMQAELDALGERANEVARNQASMEERLQRAMRDSLQDDDNDDRMDSGLSFREEIEMAAEKRALQTDLQRLEQDVKRAADGLENSDPRAAEELEDALRELREDEVDARLAVAASYIEIGEAVYVSGSESAITQSLEDFADSLERAGQLAGSGEGGNEGGGERGVAETLADTRALRRELQELGRGGQGGQELTRNGRDDLQESTGVVVPDIAVTNTLERDFDRLSDDILNQFRALRESGVSPREIDDLRRLAADVRASDFSGNEALLEREAEAALALVEQIEIALARALRTDAARVRATPNEEIPDEHREPVANYFRRLGESSDDEE